MKKLFFGLVSLVLMLGLVGAVSATTINVPADQPTIQAAVVAANSGDTINIAAGTYPESVDIPTGKDISLDGAGSGTNPAVDTIIAPVSGNGLFIHAPVNLKDLRVTGAPAIGTVNFHGIRVQPSPSSGTLNFDNVVWDNIASSYNAGNGAELHNGVNVNNMEIKDSEFIGNAGPGLRASSATPVNGLTITNSHLDSNKYGGYLCGGLSNLIVSYTTMNDNSQRGWYCSEIGKITNIKFENCEANDNGLRGITVFTYNAEGIDGVEIRNTEIKNNPQRGLHIGAAGDPPGGWAEDAPSPIKNVLVEDCDILNNGNGPQSDKAGFHLDIGALTNVVVRNCNIIGNNDFGVYNADTYSSGVVDATSNWWGATDGPCHTTSWTYDSTTIGPNAGSGDTVTDYVLYDPWLGKMSFAIEHAKLDFKKKADDDKVRVQGKLALDLTYGDGVDISEPVTVTVGTLSETITMVEKGKKGEKWEYERLKGGTGDIKKMTIDWKKGSFDIRMDKADLTGITNPVTISIQIGDDLGSESILMTEKEHHWDYKAEKVKSLEASEAGESIVQIESGLYQNYPNPFNPTTTIEYSLAEGSDVLLKIYNLSGKLIRTLVNEYQTAGYYSITWYGDNEVGQEIASGVYFYRIQAGDFVSTKKMVVLK